MTLKFGDIIDNGYASDTNPHKYGIVVNATSKQIKVTNGKGTFWIVDNHDRITKLGSVHIWATETLANVQPQPEIIE